MLKADLAFDARDIVGESLVYDDRRDALVWVDIGGKRIRRLWRANGRRPRSGLTATAVSWSACATASRDGPSAASSRPWRSSSLTFPTIS
jgi:sugar lactone lactonase YvrE